MFLSSFDRGAETAGPEGEPDWRAVVEALATPVTLVDARAPDQPLVYVNPAFCAMTGYALEEALGRNCRFLQGRDRDQPELERMRWAIREGRPGVFLLRNYRKNGEMFYNELHLSPLADASGRAARFVGVQHEVTERERNSRALAESERRYRELVESIDGVVWEADPATLEPRAAEPVTRAFWPAGGWSRAIDPRDREPVLAFRRAQAAEGRARQEMEYRLRGPDGRLRWVRDISTFAIGADGERRLRGLTIDVSDLYTGEIRQRERTRLIAEELRALAERLSPAEWASAERRDDGG